MVLIKFQLTMNTTKIMITAWTRRKRSKSVKMRKIMVKTLKEETKTKF